MKPSKKVPYPTLFEYWKERLAFVRFLDLQNCNGTLLCSNEFKKPPFTSEDGATFIANIKTATVKRTGQVTQAFLVDVKGRKILPIQIGGWDGLRLLSTMLYSGATMTINELTLTIPFN